MKRFTTALATMAFAFIGVTNFAPKFCQGIRVAEGDNIDYGKWIDLKALSEQEAAELNDPVLRNQYRMYKAKKWRGQVKEGQVAHCGSTTL